MKYFFGILVVAALTFMTFHYFFGYESVVSFDVQDNASHPDTLLLNNG